MKKNILITGGTSGIGFNAAKTLVKNPDNSLILIGQNINKGKLAIRQLKQISNNKNVSFLNCDLSSLDEIKKFFKSNKFSKLDILVNNAGAVFFNKSFSKEKLEKTFALNHLGYFLFTHFVIKKNLIKKNSKIINVASGAHWGVDLDFDDLEMSKNYNGWIAYKKSKLCNILFTKKLSQILTKDKINVNCLHPGFVQTNFGSNNNCIIKLGIKFAMKFGGININEGTETLLYLIKTESKISGEYFYKSKISPSSNFSMSKVNANKLWDKSLEITSKYL
tara:strand:+ start:1432 stop:2265 length:834 start_codon:yes stop_codon:yes gene_type:complete